jgi:formylglycine-generating enzyme
MIWIEGASFLMGSNDFYPEERPMHRAAVHGFWIDEHPVTVDEFARFVEETGYVTVAERPLDPADYPGADPALLLPGALVFQKTDGPVDLTDFFAWWRYVPAASWRAPEGPGSAVDDRGRHPVVQVAYEDAEAYATWAGKNLPSEAEWEYAARGGLEGASFTWGDEQLPGGRPMANTWQGEFPWENLLADGYEGTSPVEAFPPNGYGLHDMTGNVWEWTSDDYAQPHPEATTACCGPGRREPNEPGDTVVRSKVIKGGSHLCAPNYCLRYRPAARQPETVDTSTGHIGFRCVKREPGGSTEDR